jgi:hypothetical protein
VYPAQFNLGTLKGRDVITNFAGGRITSDAGIVLMAELEKKLRITARFAKCFREHRNLSYVDYSVHELLHKEFTASSWDTKMSMTRISCATIQP